MYICVTSEDAEMDVRGAPGIRHRLDRAEAPGAVIGDHGAAEALEVRICGAARVARMVVDAERVALPDLEACPAHRAPVRIEHAPAQVQDRARRRLRAAGDLDQIVVRIERQFERIERPRGLPRCRHQGGGAGQQSVQPGERARGDDQMSPAQAWMRARHGSSPASSVQEYDGAAGARLHTSARGVRETSCPGENQAGRRVGRRAGGVTRPGAG
jgi:hypothetical protein